uniref:Uncharacterized protein n=1 Tax=Cyprinus carpio carpio TaxID=630221 RepID=A0A9J8CLP1_CYPCA
YYRNTVWERERQEKAVKVWLSDGRIETFGNPAGPYQEYAFKLGLSVSPHCPSGGTEQEHVLEPSNSRTNRVENIFFTVTFNVEVKAWIPEIQEVSIEFTDERTETLSNTVDVPPKKKVDFDITIVKITCKNGSVLQYETKGQYRGITVIKVNTKESDL